MSVSFKTVSTNYLTIDGRDVVVVEWTPRKWWVCVVSKYDGSLYPLDGEFRGPFGSQASAEESLELVPDLMLVGG